MKKIKALLVTVAISVFVYAQDKEGIPLSELYLKDTWTVSCLPEVTSPASMLSCSICSFVTNPENKSKGEIIDVEMTFLADSITINQNGKKSTVPYKRNQDTHAINFSFNGQQYNFRMFLYGKKRILEDANGLLLILEETK